MKVLYVPDAYIGLLKECIYVAENESMIDPPDYDALLALLESATDAPDYIRLLDN